MNIENHFTGEMDNLKDDVEPFYIQLTGSTSDDSSNKDWEDSEITMSGIGLIDLVYPSQVNK